MCVTQSYGLKQAGRLRGHSPPPPFANTLITGSERVHMGFVFAGKMMLEAILHSFKHAGVSGEVQPAPTWQQNACMMVLEMFLTTGCFTQ